MLPPKEQKQIKSIVGDILSAQALALTMLNRDAQTEQDLKDLATAIHSKSSVDPLIHVCDYIEAHIWPKDFWILMDPDTIPEQYIPSQILMLTFLDPNTVLHFKKFVPALFSDREFFRYAMLMACEDSLILGLSKPSSSAKDGDSMGSLLTKIIKGGVRLNPILYRITDPTLPRDTIRGDLRNFFFGDFVQTRI